MTLEQRLIESLCPSEAAVAVFSGVDAIELFPEEESAVATALDTRREEFALGRACARDALSRLGVSPAPIPVSPDRAPSWPEGIVGSITHSAGFACAVVARSDSIAGIGIDIEARQRPMRETLERFIRTPAERISQQNLPLAIDPLRLVFSAKESVHKCVAPLSGVTLGFHDVELDVDVASRTFRARLVGRCDAAIPDLDLLSGRFAITSHFVITTAAILAGCGGRATMPLRRVARV